MGNFSFQKKERLTRKKIIDGLFKKGPSSLFFPLKVIATPSPDQSQLLHQVLISVPARNFKKAVDRNTLKRRIREGYRLNKAHLPASPALCLAYIYIAKEILPSATIHQAIVSSMESLKHEKKS
jgi:ribonuclease P protein component